MLPSNTPKAPPIVNNGASVPPEVPLPREITQEIYLRKQRESNIANGKFPFSKSCILSYPTPIVSGAK